ncbi:TatD family hydrolase [Breznakiella homolactica]|uniref:TatD family hydrolase n=1 Tax=Breznakiella homolactica TaxID=2798577 RepID=A0A7T7XJ87_9SPIR|nr:TatD family hydrolase [Breznakiella homolactica]QQO07434.1 TatD family hydrolase [Breznakiella homolactica]
MKGLIDTHAHLSMLSRRGIPAEQRLSELFAGGFRGIIDIGTEAGDLSGRIAAFKQFGKIRFTAGIWPSGEAIEERASRAAELEGHIREAPEGYVVAVGECGLDRHWNTAENGADLAGERELLELQLDLARRLSLPVIIHSRDSAKETAEVLARHRDVTAVIHCFSYGYEEAKTFLDLGCFISFAGNATYKSAGSIREALAAVPLDRLLLETDCPYLAPVPHRGKAAEPGMVSETYRLASGLKSADHDYLAEEIGKNVVSLFRIDW